MKFVYQGSLLSKVITALLGSIDTTLPDGFKLNDREKNKGLEYYRKKQQLNDESMPHPKDTYVLNGSLVSDLLIAHDLECGYTNVFDPYDWDTLGCQLLNLCRDKHIALVPYAFHRYRRPSILTE